MANFFERMNDEGLISSEQNMTLTAMQDGFMTTFFESDGKWQGLAYRKDLMGNEIELKTPKTPSRKDAELILNQYIKAYLK